MREYTAKTLIKTYHWAKAHPAGIIAIDRMERLTGTEWLAWFRKCLDKKINREIKTEGRKWEADWYWAMMRTARDVNTPILRVYWVPAELRGRLAHRIATRGDC